MNGPRRIVVVGNGIAGVTAADTLRDAGHDGELTLVGDEQHAAYSRPALSKALLRDELSAHVLPPTSHGATELLGTRRSAWTSTSVGCCSEAVSPCRTTAWSSRRAAAPDCSGPRRTIPTYSRCAPSTTPGASGPVSPTVPPWSWSATVPSAWRSPPGAWTRGAPSPSSPAVGRSPRSWVRTSPTSSWELPEVRDCGSSSTAEAELAIEGGRTQVVLADGRRLDADLVVTAVGDLPNVEWLAGSGLLSDGVLVTDDRGRVRPDVVAAGDVAAVPTPFGVRRTPLWSSAIEQGKVAAAALLHGDAVEPLESRPYFWTEQFGLSLKAVGHMPLIGEPEVIDGDVSEGRALLRWNDRHRAAVALNYRIPVPRLRRLCEDPVAAR